MRCLYCDKEISKNSNIYEIQNLWHKKCIKQFFGTDRMPIIDLDNDLLNKLTLESVNNGFTVTGVQQKLSLNLSNDNNPRLTLLNCPSGFILKPQSKDYPCLPEAEYLAMQMANSIHINVVPFGLIKMKDSDEFAYITKRVDRIVENDKITKLAMEDFCQLDERSTEDKYKGSYERCAKIINKYSSLKMFDLSELFIRLVFSFVIGNSDMHLKNFSLIEYEGKYRLSPAYDLLPVQAIVEDNEEFALTMCSKKNKIKRNDFIDFARNIGLNDKVATKTINKLINSENLFMSQIECSYLNDSLKTKMKNIINERINILKNN